MSKTIKVDVIENFSINKNEIHSTKLDLQPLNVVGLRLTLTVKLTNSDGANPQSISGEKILRAIDVILRGTWGDKKQNLFELFHLNRLRTKGFINETNSIVPWETIQFNAGETKTFAIEMFIQTVDRRFRNWTDFIVNGVDFELMKVQINSTGDANIDFDANGHTGVIYAAYDLSLKELYHGLIQFVEKVSVKDKIETFNLYDATDPFIHFLDTAKIPEDGDRFVVEKNGIMLYDTWRTGTQYTILDVAEYEFFPVKNIVDTVYPIFFLELHDMSLKQIESFRLKLDHNINVANDVELMYIRYFKPVDRETVKSKLSVLVPNLRTPDRDMLVKGNVSFIERR